MSARLTDAEREELTRLFGFVPEPEPLAAMLAAVERILADRLAKIEAERDALVRQVIAARSRAEEANTALADLRARVEALAQLALGLAETEARDV